MTTREEKVVAMKSIRIASMVVCLLAPAFAQQAPYGRKNVPVSAHDRVYSADQTSNTVSVVDPSTNKMLGVIKLGDPVPASLSPLYKGALMVHGMGYSPDSKTLAVVSVGSNSVTFINPATNQVKGTVYVGRSPHEAFFTPDGREIWVTVRGENYVSVIDPAQMKEVRRIELANGPGMTMFTPDGKYGFVCSSFTPELSVVDGKTHQVVSKLKQASPFCPDIAVSPEGDEVWITLKDAGKVQVFDAKPPFAEKVVMETGPITNHVNFANNANGKFVYVTIGGTNEVKVFRRGAKPELVATIPVGDLPHGIWPSGDGSRVYVALENGAAMAAIDTMTNKVIANVPIGQTAQALVYVPNAVPNGAGTDNLTPIGQAGNTAHVELQSAGGAFPKARASAAVNSLGALDLVEIAAIGLAPKSQYQVYLSDSEHAPFSKLEPLGMLKTNADGGGIAQAIGPLKSVAASPAAASAAQPRRYLVVTAMGDSSQVVLVQAAEATMASH
jgi:YVTN family beta-propeller protein